ncbi:MAG TPA: DUF6491 family protein [Rudaea sp.]|nr:DUF6491 family protein [Rudaea sp.]
MRTLLLTAAMFAVAGTAVADTRATEDKNLARYQQYAGTSVDNFPMWNMYQWQSLGPDWLAVWTAVNDVYLLKVSQPCIRLEDAKGIQVTSQMAHQVTRRLDYVNFGTQHCQIVEIRPVDYKTMLKEGRDGKAKG